MKKYILICITMVLLISVCSCGSKNKEIIDNTINDEEITSLPVNSQVKNPKSELQDVEDQIQKIDDKISTVKILFASSTIESSSLDIVIVSLTTDDNYKVSKNEKNSINEIINNSTIKEIINYKEIKIQYN